LINKFFYRAQGFALAGGALRSWCRTKVPGGASIKD